jgi:hypothetical protein
MIAGANRIRDDAFLVLPHYPLFAVTMETVETNFLWRGIFWRQGDFAGCDIDGIFPISEASHRIWSSFCVHREHRR